MKELQKMVGDWLADRPTMYENNQDPQRLIELLEGEVVEVAEVMDQPEKLGRELADVAWFLMTVANLKGIDLEAEVREKAAVNSLRYSANLFQEGDYEEARKQVKANEKPIIDEFYSI